MTTPEIEMGPGGDRPVGRTPPPGGPHDPDAPDRLEPATDAGPPPPDHTGDDGPEGEDPMAGEAPSG